MVEPELRVRVGDEADAQDLDGPVKWKTKIMLHGLTAETDVDGIYKEGDGTFFFERTMSRLIEMRSEDYLAKRKDRAEALNAGDGAEAVAATTT